MNLILYSNIISQKMCCSILNSLQKREPEIRQQRSRTKQDSLTYLQLLKTGVSRLEQRWQHVVMSTDSRSLFLLEKSAVCCVFWNCRGTSM